MTCWRRLAEWNEAEVWQRLHELLPAELHAARSFRLKPTPPADDHATAGIS